jgi:predicted 2-oxoglutarate/Fe(II)-dependent dioxygenase YbiX/peroxiredoxin
MSDPRPPGPGELAPFFHLPCGENPTFHLGSMGGIWLVLLFHGSLVAPVCRAAHDLALAQRALFDDRDAAFFGVSIDPSDVSERGMTDLRVGVRYFQDFHSGVSRGYGVLAGKVHTPTIFLLDRMLRVVAVEPAARMAQVLDRLRDELAAEKADPTPTFAPVLTVPRVFEPEFCRELIAYYEKAGGEASGFMRDVDGKTVGLLDASFKRRRDAFLEEGALREAACERISRRLLPVVARALGWRATRIERYIVACYSAEDRGFFRRHRDNTTAATAYRKFAVTLNLNAEDYDGGELVFPEFGTRTYKPPTGGATVFACGLLHEATPVTRGVRYAFLPFLYDEAGKQKREATKDLIVPVARMTA